MNVSTSTGTIINAHIRNIVLHTTWTVTDGLRRFDRLIDYLFRR